MRIPLAGITLIVMMVTGQTGAFGNSDNSLIMDAGKMNEIRVASGLEFNHGSVVLAQAKTMPFNQANGNVDEFEEEFDDNASSVVKDPFAGYNRTMTTVNDKLMTWLIFPAARGYNKIFPEELRNAIKHFFKNIAFPVRFVNNVLQLKFKQAGIEFARFGINSTTGIFGLVDVAQDHFNLDAQNEDFGQTLGWYGAGSGFYLVLPLLGPSNLRDALGLVPDYFLDPIGYLDSNTASISLGAGFRFNNISLSMDDYENIKENAVDFYLILRDGYEQNRLMKIKE